MTDAEGIRRALDSYDTLFDAKQWAGLALIFTADASLTTRRGTVIGRDAVIETLKWVLLGYNGPLWTSNELITVAGETAQVESDFLGVDNNKILASGNYYDTLVKSGDTWLFTCKTIEVTRLQSLESAARACHLRRWLWF